MDEARLKELIEKAERMGMGWFEDEEIDTFVPALIAALRDVQKKLNIVIDNSTEWEMKYYHEKERADRAEEEVERLGKLVKQAQDWLQMYEKDSGFLAKIEALERVRAAAEHGDIWLRVSAADPDGQIPVSIAWFTNLRRVLDAAKEDA